jgi:hypothetical protein
MKTGSGYRSALRSATDGFYLAIACSIAVVFLWSVMFWAKFGAAPKEALSGIAVYYVFFTLWLLAFTLAANIVLFSFVFPLFYRHRVNNRRGAFNMMAPVILVTVAIVAVWIVLIRIVLWSTGSQGEPLVVDIQIISSLAAVTAAASAWFLSRMNADLLRLETTNREI